MNKKEEQKLHNSNFIDACSNAINGIIYATTTQRKIKKQLIIAVIVMILSLFFDLERSEFLCLVISVVLVIFAEMVNTAIETLVDLYVDVYHPKAKIAKDVGAGAVVVTAFSSIIVAYFLFFEKIGTIGTKMIESVVTSENHLVFVAIILVVIAVIAVKAICTKRKDKVEKQIFTPSGQSAIAFAVLTAIWLTTKNIVVFTLALVLSLLVVENRRLNNVRTTAEIIFGISMGVLIVLMVYWIASNAGNLSFGLI